MKNKINVNISPNPLDLQTLHCSQNDTSERKFYFTLHNNGEVIDTTDISDPIFEPFDVYKGGTEQILPVNTDDPTTSPIIADIQYPDEEKTEQEFTYRESPTTIDGKALVEKIKGNTIVWNQLIQNGNFADISRWSMTGQRTMSASGNVLTITLNESTTHFQLTQTLQKTALTTHKYFITLQVMPSFACASSVRLGANSNVSTKNLNANTWMNWDVIVSPVGDGTNFVFFISNTHLPSSGNVQVKNVNVFDLTAMFGATKADEILAMETAQEGSGVAYFRSLYSLPYYQYDSGSLLSFNGTGIKATGKNLVFKILSSANLGGDGTIVVDNQNIYDLAVAEVVGGKQYHIGNNRGDTALIGWFTNEPQIGSTTYDGQRIVGSSLFPIAPITGYIVFRIDKPFAEPTFNLGTGNIDYEPYTSATLDIPTSAYFPTGMKSAGSVYDELTNSKAITRIGSVDLGSLSWGYNSTYGMYSLGISNLVKKPSADNVKANAVCAIRELAPFSSVFSGGTSSGKFGINANGTIGISTTETNTDTFKASLDGVMLQYELKEEQIDNFTQASLICEDGESALYQDVDSLVCECTEDFSKDSGFKDCKIKFSKGDGVVYSNKIQLHIERKP